MTRRLANALRMQAGSMDAQLGQARWGTVQSYDSVKVNAKILMQPEGVLSGWLPVLSPMVGDGYGLLVPPSPNQQVAFIADNGDHNHGIIVGSTWSNAAAAPQPPKTPGGSDAPVVPGEAALVSKSGSYILLNNDGSVLAVNGSMSVLMASDGITINGGGQPVHITNGDLHVDGAIIAGWNGADQVTLQQHRHGSGSVNVAVATLPPTPFT